MTTKTKTKKKERSKDRHEVPITKLRPPRKTTVRVPRKQATQKKKRYRKDPSSVGKSVVHEWANSNGGHIRVGQTVIDIMKGKEDLSTWTDKELRRGAPMRVSRRPHVIPLAVYDELVSRYLSRAKNRLAGKLVRAVNTVSEIMEDEEAPPSVRLLAAKEVLDRVMGKAPEHVMVHDGDKPYKDLIAASVVSTDEQLEELESGEVIEGEVLDDTREEDGG